MTVWFGGQQLGQSDHLLEAAVELAVTERHRTCDQIKRALWLPGIPRGLSGRRQPGCEASPLTGELGGAFVGGRGGGMTARSCARRADASSATATSSSPVTVAMA